jgi:hypothetical protein
MNADERGLKKPKPLFFIGVYPRLSAANPPGFYRVSNLF